MAGDRGEAGGAGDERRPVIDENNVLVGYTSRWSDTRWEAWAPDGTFHGAFRSNVDAQCSLVESFSPSLQSPADRRCDLVVVVDEAVGLAWCATHRVDPSKLVTWEDVPARLAGTSRLRVRLLATSGTWPDGWEKVALAITHANASYV